MRGSVGLLCLAALPASAQQRMTLVEELRIGALDGPAALSRVASVVQSADGRSVYVADSRDQVIRIFDAGTGALVRTIGGPGAGPGEFRRIGALTFRADTLYAAGTGQRRIVVFTREGEHVNTRRIASAPLAETARPAVVRAPTPAGTWWAESPLDAGLVAAGRVTAFPSVALSREGEVLTTVATQRVAGFMDRAEFGGRIAMFIQPMRSPASVAARVSGRRSNQPWRPVGTGFRNSTGGGQRPRGHDSPAPHSTPSWIWRPDRRLVPADPVRRH